MDVIGSVRRDRGIDHVDVIRTGVDRIDRSVEVREDIDE